MARPVDKKCLRFIIRHRFEYWSTLGAGEVSAPKREATKQHPSKLTARRGIALSVVIILESQIGTNPL
jgi:hypothetical protein